MIPDLIKRHDEISLSNILKSNYEVITIMGLFGAISVYLGTIGRRVPVDSSIIEIGVLASLFLFIYTFSIFQYNIIKDVGSLKLFLIYVMDFRSDAISLAVFLVPLYVIIVSFLLMIISLEQRAITLFKFLAIFAGIVSFDAFNDDINVLLTKNVFSEDAVPSEVDSDDRETEVEDETLFAAYFSYILTLFLSYSVVIIGALFLNHLTRWYGFGYADIFSFSPSKEMIIIVAGFTSGMVIPAVIYSVGMTLLTGIMVISMVAGLYFGNN